MWKKSSLAVILACLLPSPASAGLADVIDCSNVRETDVRAVAWNIADDWSNFEDFVEDETGLNIKSCMENRFSKNGKVKCITEYKCKSSGKCKLGGASPFTRKIKIYQTFFDNISSMSQPDRRACYSGLMAHEFAHSCDRLGEPGAEGVETAAFRYWKDRFAVTSDLHPKNDCGFD